MSDYAKAFKEKYLDYWHLVFPQEFIGKPASFVFVEDAVESCYSPGQDELRLCLAGWDLDGVLSANGSVAEVTWEEDRAWKRELVHELCHEVQNKLFDLLDLPNGEMLLSTVKVRFSGPGHDASFYSAIAYVAAKFRVSPQELERRL